MLSDDERRTLDELERQLAGQPASEARPSVPGGLQFLGTLTLSLLMLACGATAGAVAFGAAAVAIGLAWWYANDPGPDTASVHPRDGQRI